MHKGIVVGWVLSISLGCATSGFATTEDRSPQKVEAKESTECPWLTRQKYPFLVCQVTKWGSIVLSGPAVQLAGSQMPELDPYVESDAYWGH